MKVVDASEAGAIRHAQRPIPRFDSLPWDHCTVAIDEPWMFPFLRPGEFAVIDLTDRAPADGDLFLIQHATGERWRGVRQLKRDRALLGDAGRRGKQSICWWIGDPVTPTAFLPRDASGDDLGAEIRRWDRRGAILRLPQGPFHTFNIRRMLAGRVVGYAKSAFGKELAPTAGWESEITDKAAFDPAEYVTLMLETGHTFRARKNAAGDVTGFQIEMPKKPMTGQEWREFCRIADTRLRASNSRDLIMAECQSRGLFSGQRRTTAPASARAA